MNEYEVYFKGQVLNVIGSSVYDVEERFLSIYGNLPDGIKEMEEPKVICECYGVGPQGMDLEDIVMCMNSAMDVFEKPPFFHYVYSQEYNQEGVVMADRKLAKVHAEKLFQSFVKELSG